MCRFVYYCHTSLTPSYWYLIIYSFFPTWTFEVSFPFFGRWLIGCFSLLKTVSNFSLSVVKKLLSWYLFFTPLKKHIKVTHGKWQRKIRSFMMSRLRCHNYKYNCFTERKPRVVGRPEKWPLAGNIITFDTSPRSLQISDDPRLSGFSLIPTVPTVEETVNASTLKSRPDTQTSN